MEEKGKETDDQYDPVANFSFDHLKCCERINSGPAETRVVYAHLYCDYVLMKIIEEELRKPKFLPLDRLTFSSKLDLACALGLINDAMRSPLKLLGKYRNKISHQIEFTFDDDAKNRLFVVCPEMWRDAVNEALQKEEWRAQFNETLVTIVAMLEVHRQLLGHRRKERSEAFVNLRRVLDKEKRT